MCHFNAYYPRLSITLCLSGLCHNGAKGLDSGILLPHLFQKHRSIQSYERFCMPSQRSFICLKGSRIPSHFPKRKTRVRMNLGREGG